MEFNGKSKEEIKILNKTSSKWIEFDTTTKKGGQSSTTETFEAQGTKQGEDEVDNCVELRIATIKQEKSQKLGIGVTATLGNQVKAEWAIRERSTNSDIQDEALAIRLALSNVLKYQWSKIRIVVRNKKTGKMA